MNSPSPRRLAALCAFTLATAAVAQTTPSQSNPPGAIPPPIPESNPAQPSVNPADQKAVQPLSDPATPATPAPDAAATGDFSEIDRQLDELKRRVENAPSPQARDEAKVRLAALRDRGTELKQNFHLARFELFKSDVREELEALKSWTGEKRAGAAAPDADPSKAGEFAGIDIDLKLLESRVEMMSDTNEKSQATRRLAEFRQRRQALGQTFDQDKLNSLERDVRAEWDRISR